MGNYCKYTISNVAGYMFTSFIFAYSKPLFVARYINNDRQIHLYMQNTLKSGAPEYGIHRVTFST